MSPAARTAAPIPRAIAFFIEASLIRLGEDGSDDRNAIVALLGPARANFWTPCDVPWATSSLIVRPLIVGSDPVLRGNCARHEAVFRDSTAHRKGQHHEHQWVRPFSRPTRARLKFCT